MPDPVGAIENRLRTPPTTRTAAHVRKQLNTLFAQLNEKDATTLLERLLRPDRYQSPHDFRVLSRYVRLELVLRLVGKLGSPKRKEFLNRLNGPSADPALQRGRRWMFPDGTETQRRQFMKSLEGPAPNSAFPFVTLKFRNKGPFSHDNKCEVLSKPDDRVPAELGVYEAKNSVWMEIQGVVHNHQNGASYKFSRRVETLLLCKDAVGWREVKHEPEDDDNEHRYFGGEGTDEDDFPDEGNIYVVDGPSLPVADGSKTTDTECVKLLNFKETLRFWANYGTLPGAPLLLKWCACLSVERKNGGDWKMNANNSGNRTGEIDFPELRRLLKEHEANKNNRGAQKHFDPYEVFWR